MNIMTDLNLIKQTIFIKKKKFPFLSQFSIISFTLNFNTFIIFNFNFHNIQ